MDAERLLQKYVEQPSKKVRGSLRWAWENWTKMPLHNKTALVGFFAGMALGVLSPSISGFILMAGSGAVSGYAFGRVAESVPNPK